MNDLRLNVHLTSWLHPEGLNAKKRALLIDLKDHRLNEMLSNGAISVRFNYPLNHPLVSLCNGPVTVKQFIDFVAHTYERIYSEESETTSIEESRAAPWLLNRNTTDGKYGIWGHDIGDLFLEGAERGKDGVWELLMGS